MEKAYKYRIYPNKEQRVLIAKTFGCCRYVYNYYLDKRIEWYQTSKKTFSYNKCSADLTQLKSERKWLREVDSTALQSSLRHLDNAYKEFFKEQKGFPNFKSKKTNRHSYQSKCTNGNIGYFGKYIKLPKLGMVKTKNKLVPQGKIVNATVSQEPSGKYYVSLCCVDVAMPEFHKTGKNIGIDLGIKDFCVASDGMVEANPKYWKKSLDKLAKLQKRLSRKTKGSSNRNKARIKLARLHEKIANQRKDFLHKLSYQIIRDHDMVCLEDLQIKNMVKNHKLAQAITDASWSEFVKFLEYKAKWYDKKVIKIDKFFASSQTCHVCGSVNPETKDLKVREWICPQCNTYQDRDLNASINILNEGLKRLALNN